MPVGNAGNISSHWLGYSEYLRDGLISEPPQLFGFQAAGAAPLVRGEPVTDPQTIATAIRIGNPASWERAVAAATESEGAHPRPSPTARSSRRTVGSRARGCSPSRPRRRASPGCSTSSATERLPRGATVVCVLTGHGLKDPEWAITGAAHPPTVPVDVHASPPSSGSSRCVSSPASRPRRPTSGPGFDCFGLALDLCNEVTIDTDGEPGVRWEGEGADELPIDGTDLVSRAMRSVAEEAGEGHLPFHLHGVNRIPLERGLGSSAAAAVAGISLGRRWLGLLHQTFSDVDVARAAATLDGHPDNVVPAAYGGLTVVADGNVRRFDVSDAISPLVLIPTIRLSTQRARDVLPEEVARADAVFNVAHGALVIHALVTGDLDLLRVALRDRLHQQARLAMVPPVRAVFQELERSLPVCVSGAGPSLLAFTAPGDPDPDPGDGWRVLRVPVRSSGVEILDA